MKAAAWVVGTRPGVGFVKMFVTAAFGLVDDEGNREALIEVKDFELRDTKEGELYLREPERAVMERVVMERQPNNLYKVGTKDGKPWYVKTAFFPSQKSGDGYKLTKTGMAMKRALQEEAIQRFTGQQTENAGRGVAAGSKPASKTLFPRRGSAEAPAGANEQVSGSGSSGLPFPAQDADDLPF